MMLVKITMVIMTFHSYKGGTGKSTVAVHAAVSVANKGKRCLLIDTDFHAPSLFALFNTSVKKGCYFNDYLEGRADLEQVIFQTGFPNLFVSFADPKPTLNEGVLSSEKKVHQIYLRRLLQARIQFIKNYDIVMFDNSPGLNLSSINCLLVSEKSILVLRPNEYGVVGTIFLIENVYKQLGDDRKHKIYLLFNQVGSEVSDEFLNRWISAFKEINVEVLPLIRYSEAASMAMLSLDNNDFNPAPDILEQIEQIMTIVLEKL